METLLFVNGTMHEGSRTHRICKAFIDEYTKKGNVQVEEIVLADENIAPLAWQDIEKRDKLLSAGNFEDDMLRYARQFSKADKILIGVPFWDLSFPAILKAYIENVCVCGICFKYIETGSLGMCHADNLMYITSAGGPVGEKDSARLYIKEMAEFFGIEGFGSVCAECLDVEGMDVEGIIKRACEEARQKARNF